MINSLERIASSYKDPSSHVFKNKAGELIRKIEPSVRNILQKHTAFTQVESVYSEADQLYKVKKLPFISFYYEYPFPVLKDMALFYLDVLEDLLKDGYALSDGTPLNCTYIGGSKFEFFDIGSIVPFNKKKGWEGYRQFLTDFYFPLVYLADMPSVYPGSLIPFINNDRWLLNIRLSLKQKYRLPNLLFQGFITRSLKKSLDSHSTNSSTTLSERSVHKIIALLRSAITHTEDSKPKTKWDNYYTNTILQDSYLTKKEEVFRELYDKAAGLTKSGGIAVDWGANSGHFSTVMTSIDKTRKVIAIESDHNAISSLYDKHKAEPIIPVHASLFNPTPALGFENNRESLLSRLYDSCQIQVALGLIHHMQHEQNLSYYDIIRFFNDHSRTTSLLVIEYIDPSDERYRLIRNPRYPHPEGKEAFVKALQKYYHIIDRKEPIATRELFLAQKK